MNLKLHSAVRSLPEFADLERAECKALYRKQCERSRRLAYYPTFVGIAVFFGWMLLFSIVIAALDLTGAVGIVRLA